MQLDTVSKVTKKVTLNVTCNLQQVYGAAGQWHRHLVMQCKLMVCL